LKNATSKQSKTIDFFGSNLAFLEKRFFSLAAGVKAFDAESVAITNSRDNGICYAVRTDSGEWKALTNPADPILKTQEAIKQMEHRLTKGLSPAVVVGLVPGYVLETIFAHFKSRLQLNEPFRRIYVIVDSIPCLIGWLKGLDRSEILQQLEVEFYWYQDIQQIIELCQTDEQRSHLFVPVSSLPEKLTNQLISPLAELYLKREEETRQWQQKNADYYNALDDAKLAENISGQAGRKPRLLMPTHSSSTVVQFSTRDTSKAFEKMGWETTILSMDRDLSPWRLTKTIHDFKPDVLLFINHLRTEDENLDLYPDNLMFITWIQDAMPIVNRRDSAEKWNKTAKERHRDLLMGYTAQLKKFGYLEDRLIQNSMIVDTDTFKPVDLTDEQQIKYNCDICFATNRSKPTEEIIRNDLLKLLEPLGFSSNCLKEIEDMLWKHYRDEESITTTTELRGFLLTNVDQFREIFDKLDQDDQDNTIDRIFWQLNDVIYRHIVLEWLDEYARQHPDFKFNLYGKGWENHPRFNKYARGPVSHGPELNVAYNAADCCLHLNSIEGNHQRLLEIMAGNSIPLTRCKEKNKLASQNLLQAFNKMATLLFLSTDEEQNENFTDTEEMELNDYVFSLSQAILNKTPDLSLEELETAVTTKLHQNLSINPIWLFNDWHKINFTTRNELLEFISTTRKSKKKT